MNSERLSLSEITLDLSILKNQPAESEYDLIHTPPEPKPRGGWGEPIDPPLPVLSSCSLPDGSRVRAIAPCSSRQVAVKDSCFRMVKDSCFRIPCTHGLAKRCYLRFLTMGKDYASSSSATPIGVWKVHDGSVQFHAIIVSSWSWKESLNHPTISTAPKHRVHSAISQPKAVLKSAR